MVTLINISGGLVVSDTTLWRLEPGARIKLDGSLEEILGQWPELIMFIERGRLLVEENVVDINEEE